MMQQQSGMYGAIVIHKKNEKHVKEHTLLLSDWTDENPDEVDRRCIMQQTGMESAKAVHRVMLKQSAPDISKQRIANEWKRMTAMDVSDVYYDHFFSNGKVENRAHGLKPGDTVKCGL
jgi:FtsP/CotA-like multicopper oxidase with cupredoxin domain